MYKEVENDEEAAHHHALVCKALYIKAKNIALAMEFNKAKGILLG